MQRSVIECLLLALVLVACGRGGSQSPRAVETLPPAPPQSPASGSDFVVVEALPGAYAVGYRLPLTAAVSNLQRNRVKALLEGGADPNVREEDGTSWPPLGLALKGRAGYEASESEFYARWEIIELLLAHGADANIRWCDSDRPQCNERTGVTPLMYAATLGDETATNILLKHGADTSRREWRGLTAADYWGWKSTRPTSWCLAPTTKRSSEPYAPTPITEDARWLVDPEYVEQGEPGIVEELRSTPDRSVETVKDERVCEAAAVAYARHRTTERSEPRPRPIVPVAVVRAGPLWVADDQADGGGKGIFDRSWRILAWFEPPD